MKKILALFLALTLVLSMSATAFAATAEKGDSENIDVTAKYNSSSTTPDVYSVEIEWEGMTFTYSETGDKVWNPATHTYTDNTTAGWDKNEAAITVTNHSNKDVTVQFTYAAEGDTGVTGELDKTSEILAAGVENEVDKAASVTATLTIGGKPNSTVTEAGVKIGTITVEIA